MRAFATQKPSPSGPRLRLLAVSNGHGEDAVAAAVLQAMKKHFREKKGWLETKALPVVGRGKAYVRAGVALRGPLEPMPSGGFLKWDPKLWMDDLQAGLAGLTMKQMASIDAWKDETPGTVGEYDVMEGTETIPSVDWDGNAYKQAILAVGDVVPLFMAATAGGSTPFAFVGCAKSEFYERLPDGSFYEDPASLPSRLLSPTCTYLPHERALMMSEACRLIAPRDEMTAECLRDALPEQYRDRVVSLGNPMMDGVMDENLPGLNARLEKIPDQVAKVLVLPGTREGEVLRNWEKLLKAAKVAAQLCPRIICLCPHPPAWDIVPFEAAMRSQGWFMVDSHDGFTEFQLVGHEECTLLWFGGGFGNALRSADIALAMAGTATEQFVGLGKPVVTFPGEGPQFTEQFAKLQERLLGKGSLILCANPTQAGSAVVSVLQDAGFRDSCKENGRLRMGEEGAAARIASEIWNRFVDAQ
mmetsp:Transcript_3838/g.13670  ORF Transcript_3838/g.13670 Transcript_3838/m.13670 type:complete len:472 (-) Transcript_3838:1235-2650(-)